MKRFTDTELWDQEWFMELSGKLKLAVKYVYDKCDAVGVWQPNMKLLSFYVGEPVSLNELLSVSNGSLFKDIGEGRLLCQGFVEYQYGELTWNCKPHRSYIKMIEKHGLQDEIPFSAPERQENRKGYVTLSEKNETLSNNSETLSEKNETLSEISERVQEKEKEKEKEKDKRGSGGKETLSATWQPRDDGGMPLGQMREVLSGDALRERVTLWIHNETAVFLDPDRYLDRVDSFLLLAEQDPEGYNLPNSRLLENRFRNWLKYNANPPKNRMPGAEKKPDFFAGCSPKQIEFLKSQGYDEFGRQSNPLKKVD